MVPLPTANEYVAVDTVLPDILLIEPVPVDPDTQYCGIPVKLAPLPYNVVPDIVVADTEGAIILPVNVAPVKYALPVIKLLRLDSIISLLRNCVVPDKIVLKPVVTLASDTVFVVPPFTIKPVLNAYCGSACLNNNAPPVLV